MASEVKYRDIVRKIALDHYGYVTTRGAVEAGVPAVELPKLAARQGLEHVAYGLYRVPDVPPTRYDQFAVALLRGWLWRIPPRRVGVGIVRARRSEPSTDQGGCSGARDRTCRHSSS